MIGKFYLIFKQSFNHIPDNHTIPKVLYVFQNCLVSFRFTIFYLFFLEDDFSYIESLH